MRAIINSNDIIAAMTATAGAKECRHILEGVHVQVSGNRATVVATDSYRMVVAESEHGDNEPGEVTLDLTGIKLKRNGLLTIEATEDSASITVMGGVRYEPPIIDGNYPNWRQLMPEHDAEAEPLTSIGFNPSYVNDMGKAYRAWSGNSKATIWFEFRGAMRPLCMSKRDGDRSFFGIVMPCKMNGSDIVLKQPAAASKCEAKDDIKKQLRAASKENAVLAKQVEELTKQLEGAKSTAVEATPNEDIAEAERRIEGLEAKLSKIVEATKKPAAETESKVDALIAECSGITIEGRTSCAVYLGGIEKDSPEMEAAKAAGARFGNHKKFGKCWYMPA